MAIHIKAWWVMTSLHSGELPVGPFAPVSLLRLVFVCSGRTCQTCVLKCGAALLPGLPAGGWQPHRLICILGRFRFANSRVPSNWGLRCLPGLPLGVGSWQVPKQLCTLEGFRSQTSGWAGRAPSHAGRSIDLAFCILVDTLWRFVLPVDLYASQGGAL